MAINAYIANPVSQTITDGVTNKAPSENAVFDALANKASGTGTANGTNTGDETQSTIKTKLGSAGVGSDGYLLQTDWIVFNNKQPSLGYTPENISNKQNSLAVDGIGAKYPTVDAVNTGLSGKENKTTATTGAVISFAVPQVYNSPASPTTSNITNDLTGAVIGIVQKIYHNHTIAPTVPAGWVLMGSGTYTTSVLNVIYAEWVSGTRVEYWVVQQA